MTRIIYSTGIEGNHIKHGEVTGTYEMGIMFRINGIRDSVKVPYKKIVKIEAGV